MLFFIYKYYFAHVDFIWHYVMNSCKSNSAFKADIYKILLHYICK